MNKISTADKRNVIASNLLRLLKESWIVCDIHFLTAISDSWLNKHLKWFQGKDPNIGTCGYLSYHRTTRYFIQLKDVDKMENNWKACHKWKPYRAVYNKMSLVLQKKKDEQRNYYFQMMRMNIHKHNKRYLTDIPLIRAILGEKETGIITAKFIEGIVPTDSELQEYESKIHKCTINLREYYDFLKDRTKEEDVRHLKSNGRYLFHSDHIHSIISGMDIWNDNTDEARSIKATAK